MDEHQMFLTIKNNVMDGKVPPYGFFEPSGTRRTGYLPDHNVFVLTPISYDIKKENKKLVRIELSQVDKPSKAFVFPCSGGETTGFPGYCIVPENNTLPLMSFGWSGCVLKINELKIKNTKYYVFIHDYNGKQLKNRWEAFREHLVGKLNEIDSSALEELPINYDDWNKKTIIEIPYAIYASKECNIYNSNGKKVGTVNQQTYYKIKEQRFFFDSLIIPGNNMHSLKIFFSHISYPFDRYDFQYIQEYSCVLDINLPYN